MAGETNGRRVFAMEISPAYVDVAVARWQAETGKQAILDSDVRTFAGDLADVHPDPQNDWLGIRQPFIGFGHPCLQPKCAAQGAHRTDEFPQHAIAHELDDPSRILAYLRFDNSFPPDSQGGKCSRLVRLHEARVSNDIDHHDRSQAALC